jgi:hypothetical protein
MPANRVRKEGSVAPFAMMAGSYPQIIDPLPWTLEQGHGYAIDAKRKGY